MEYIIYNALLFGGIFILAKVIEYSAWWVITEYTDIFEDKE